MTTGMPSAGSAPLNSAQTRRPSNLPPRGSFRYSAMRMTLMMLPSASSRPGMTPAKNRRTTEVSVTMP